MDICVVIDQKKNIMGTYKDSLKIVQSVFPNHTVISIVLEQQSATIKEVYIPKPRKPPLNAKQNVPIEEINKYSHTQGHFSNDALSF